VQTSASGGQGGGGHVTTQLYTALAKEGPQRERIKNPKKIINNFILITLNHYLIAHIYISKCIRGLQHPSSLINVQNLSG
jgi:hypothetical protein